MPFDPNQLAHDEPGLEGSAGTGSGIDWMSLFSSLGGMGGGLASLFGGNSMKGMNKDFNQMSDWQKQYLNPYINAGQGALGDLQKQYSGLLGDPGGMLNKMGEGYKKSPGYDFAMKQAMQGAGHAAAAGGFSGTGMHEQQNMELAQGIASKDYNQYLQNTMGLYNQGLAGSQGLMSQGAQSSSELANNLSSILSQKMKMKQQGQSGHNAALSSLFGGAGGVLGSIFGGPAGGMAGSAAGNWLSHLFNK